MHGVLVVLLAGALIICVTVLIHITGLIAINKLATRLSAPTRARRIHHRFAAMVAVVLGLFVVSTAEIWLWAGCFLLLGVSGDLEIALYLSTTTYSTVGYGDVVPMNGWRLLAALEGVTGFLMIGWSTAFLVTAGTRHGPFRTGEHF